MNSAFFFLTTLIPVEAFVQNPTALTFVFDIRDVSSLLDAGISKKTPVSMRALSTPAEKVGSC
jgi:hypothetical protein